MGAPLDPISRGGGSLSNSVQQFVDRTPVAGGDPARASKEEIFQVHGHIWLCSWIPTCPNGFPRDDGDRSFRRGSDAIVQFEEKLIEKIRYLIALVGVWSWPFITATEIDAWEEAVYNVGVELPGSFFVTKSRNRIPPAGRQCIAGTMGSTRGRERG